MNDIVFPTAGVSGSLTLEEHYLLLMAPVDARVRAVIEERVLPEPRERAAVDALARRFGLRREVVRRLEVRVRACLADLPPFHAAAFVRRAEALAARLGPRAPLDAETTRRALAEALADVSPASEPTVRRLLLHIADYHTRDGWLVRADAGETG